MAPKTIYEGPIAALTSRSNGSIRTLCLVTGRTKRSNNWYCTEQTRSIMTILLRDVVTSKVTVIQKKARNLPLRVTSLRTTGTLIPQMRGYETRNDCLQDCWEIPGKRRWSFIMSFGVPTEKFWEVTGVDLKMSLQYPVEYYVSKRIFREPFWFAVLIGSIAII